MNKFAALFFVTLSFFIVSCKGTKSIQNTTVKKISPIQLQSDLMVLKRILQANHPSLYWYTPKDSIDYFFTNTYNGITDSLTEQQFKIKLSWLMSKIRCGHTSVQSSKRYDKSTTVNREPFFPLLLKTWNDSLVVLGNAIKNDSALKRGTAITSINGLENKTILDSLKQFISTDGYSDNFKNQIISLNFPLAYKNSYGISNHYIVGYIDSAGANRFDTLENYIPFRDTLKTKRDSLPQKSLPPLSKKEIRQIRVKAQRKFTIDSSFNMAIMKIAGFHYGSMRPFYRNNFRQLKNQHINNLVIDLRENGGGNIALSNLLTKYVAAAPFRFADTVAAINRNFKGARYIRGANVYRVAMFFSTKKKEDGRFHFSRLEQHYFKLKNKLHFDGHIYILQGGYTFSAASSFIAHLKSQQNVTLVGEETGGGAYGNSAVHLPVIVLPESKLRIVLPVYRVVFNHNELKDGHGILPDVYVPPSSIVIKKGLDAKMEMVKELIRKKIH